jgi:hypothetical protein
MSSWLSGMVPEPVKRLYHALSHSRKDDEVALQAHPSHTTHPSEQPVAPAPPPSSNRSHNPSLPVHDMPSLDSDTDSSSCSDDDGPSFLYPSNRRHHTHSSPSANINRSPHHQSCRRRHATSTSCHAGQIDSAASDNDDDASTIHFPAPLTHLPREENLPSQPPPRHRSPTPAPRRPLRNDTPAPRHAAPVSKISWRDWVGCAPPSTAPPAVEPDATVNAAAALLQDIHSTIVCDGSPLAYNTSL